MDEKEKNVKPSETAHETQKVKAEIFGEVYPFKTDSDPEYIKKLAAKVDQCMKEESQKMRLLSVDKIAIMAAMQIADEYFKLKADYDDLVELLNEK